MVKKPTLYWFHFICKCLTSHQAAAGEKQHHYRIRFAGGWRVLQSEVHRRVVGRHQESRKKWAERLNSLVFDCIMPLAIGLVLNALKHIMGHLIFFIHITGFVLFSVVIFCANGRPFRTLFLQRAYQRGACSNVHWHARVTSLAADFSPERFVFLSYHARSVFREDQ